MNPSLQIDRRAAGFHRQPCRHRPPRATSRSRIRFTSMRPVPGPPATPAAHAAFVLFKVRVVTLVLVTAWGGYYLGAMDSGVSSVQRGLLGALLGIGLVSAGAGAPQ